MIKRNWRNIRMVALGAFAGLGSLAIASNEAHFAFGGHNDAGTVAVSDQPAFSRPQGYGFEPAHAVVDASTACDQPASPTSNPIAEIDTTTRFSVVLPEGTYRVDLHFDKKPIGAIIAEARRFYVWPGSPLPKPAKDLSFVVDLRHAALPPLPPNAPGGKAVRLNPRECGSYSWDDKLTLGLTEDANHLIRLDIVPVDTPRLFILGDSTTTDQPQSPYAGWGQMLPLFFGPGIAIANHGESGETLKSFLSELRLDKIISQAKPGDWALIQFSHNDEKAEWPQTHEPADSTFPMYLKIYIAELKRKGVHPILVTPMQRMRFDTAGKIIDTHGSYPSAIRAVAASENVPVIDLNEISRALFETLGPEQARTAFAGNGRDATHQSTYGALELARALVDGIRKQNLPLSSFIKREIPPFDPTTPDAAKTANQ